MAVRVVTMVPMVSVRDVHVPAMPAAPPAAPLGGGLRGVLRVDSDGLVLNKGLRVFLDITNFRVCISKAPNHNMFRHVSVKKD